MIAVVHNTIIFIREKVRGNILARKTQNGSTIDKDRAGHQRIWQLEIISNLRRIVLKRSFGRMGDDDDDWK